MPEQAMHGVLVFDDGRKEEGKWEDGRLAIPLKRKKLSIKQYQMEGRVRQAHTSAIQAANNARTKAILAESRASTSSTKAQAANTVANDAEADAQKALDKKKQYQLMKMVLFQLAMVQLDRKNINTDLDHTHIQAH